MATLDQLPAEQRAIIELVVQRGRSYDELSDVLGIPGPRVRELAREALTQLAPVSARRVEDDRRGQIADYVLHQQSGAEQAATQAHLRRSESARAWSSSLVDSLAGMYPGAPPEIPEAEEESPPRRERERPRERDRGRERDRARAREREREPARERRPAREPARRREKARGAVLSPAAQEAVRRRRLIGAGIVALVVVAAVLGVVFIGGGGGDKKNARAAPARPQTRILGELLLKPVRGASGNNQGIAIVAQRGGERDLIVQAKMTPSKQGQAYEVWLYNSPSDAVAVGAQVTDPNGNYQGAGRLPADLSKFRFIDVSLQTIPDAACQRSPACLRRAARHSGRSVLRGNLAEMRAPGQSGATGATGPTGPAP